MLPRLTRRAFGDLAIWMTGFGLLVGLIFPLCMPVMGIAAAQVQTPGFFAASVAAGLIVGGVNFALAHSVFRPRLRLMADHMGKVEETLRSSIYSSESTPCDPQSCRIPEDSEDELGESARSFNQLVATLVRAREVEQAVGHYSQALTSHLEFTPLTRSALDLLLRYTGAEGGAILVQEEGQLVVAASEGLTDPDALTDSDRVRRSLRGSELQSLAIPEAAQLEATVTRFPPAEVLVLPIEYKQADFGAVVLAAPHPFPEDIQGLLALFQPGLGLALHNSMAHERLQKLAATDPLTGTFNRRFGMMRLREELARATRSDNSLALIMLDIDHFKEVNDTYGHMVGDRILVKIAEAASRSLREGDILIRYGGEEMIAILPGASLADGRDIARRIHQVVRDTVIDDGQQTHSVTISVGVTAYPEQSADDEDALVHLVDQAMYEAKKSGRDQVRTAA